MINAARIRFVTNCTWSGWHFAWEFSWKTVPLSRHQRSDYWAYAKTPIWLSYAWRWKHQRAPDEMYSDLCESWASGVFLLILHMAVKSINVLSSSLSYLRPCSCFIFFDTWDINFLTSKTLKFWPSIYLNIYIFQCSKCNLKFCLLTRIFFLYYSGIFNVGSGAKTPLERLSPMPCFELFEGLVWAWLVFCLI